MALPANLTTGDIIDETWVDAVTTALTPSAWTAVTFTGTWVNLGGTHQVAQYRKVADMVQLRGQIRFGASGTSAFTLPAGFRPPADLYQVANGGGSQASTSAGLVIGADGTVKPFSVNLSDVGIACQFSVTA